MRGFSALGAFYTLSPVADVKDPDTVRSSRGVGRRGCHHYRPNAHRPESPEGDVGDSLAQPALTVPE